MRSEPIPTKTTSSPIWSYLAVVALIATAIQLVACAETETLGGTVAGGKVRQATTCPQCKMVAVTVPQPIGPSFVYGRPFTGFGSQYAWGGLGNGFNWGVATLETTVYEDRCPGCKGTLKTFFTDGRWKHKCTVCEQKPFTCPVAHRT